MSVFFFPVASGPGTPDSIEGVSQHLSPESSRKAYCRTWEQPCQSASFTHMAQSPNVFSEHSASSSMSPGTASHNLKSPAVTRSRSVSDSSVPQRGQQTTIYFFIFLNIFIRWMKKIVTTLYFTIGKISLGKKEQFFFSIQKARYQYVNSF